MNSLLRKTIPLVSLLLVSLASCSGGGGEGDTIGAGGQDYVPDSTDNGGGRPDNATNVTCSSAQADCAYWFCRCEDGAVVNSANCVNGFCLDAQASCPDACSYFDHGDWTGAAGGGPTQEPPGPNCGSQGGSLECQQCSETECCSQSASCTDNPECLNLWDCVVDCRGDGGCVSNCEDQHFSGVDDFYSYTSCLDSNCLDEC